MSALSADDATSGDFQINKLTSLRLSVEEDDVANRELSFLALLGNRKCYAAYIYWRPSWKRTTKITRLLNIVN